MPSGSSPGFAESKAISWPFMFIFIAMRSYLTVRRFCLPSSCFDTAVLISMSMFIFCSIFCGPRAKLLVCTMFMVCEYFLPTSHCCLSSMASAAESRAVLSTRAAAGRSERMRRFIALE